MSHTLDMVMITQQFLLKTLEENFSSSEKLKIFYVLSSTFVKVTADTLRNSGQPKRRRQKHPKASTWISKEDGYLEMCLICVIAVLKTLLFTR